MIFTRTKEVVIKFLAKSNKAILAHVMYIICISIILNIQIYIPINEIISIESYDVI